MRSNITKRYYSYVLRYPDDCFNRQGVDVSNVVFYVGKGQRDRAFSHENEARTSCVCKKCAAIRYVWSLGKNYITEIVAQSEDEAEILQHEKLGITKIYASVHLVNIAGNEQAKRIPRMQQTIYLPREMAKWLRVQAAIEEREISEVVAQALEEYRKKRQ